eukprot:4637562-Pyramimonas_sp.AAC.1
MDIVCTRRWSKFTAKLWASVAGRRVSRSRKAAGQKNSSSRRGIMTTPSLVRDHASADRFWVWSVHRKGCLHKKHEPITGTKYTPLETRLETANRHESIRESDGENRSTGRLGSLFTLRAFWCANRGVGGLTVMHKYAA